MLVDRVLFQKYVVKGDTRLYGTSTKPAPALLQGCVRADREKDNSTGIVLSNGDGAEPGQHGVGAAFENNAKDEQAVEDCPAVQAENDVSSEGRQRTLIPGFVVQDGAASTPPTVNEDENSELASLRAATSYGRWRQAPFDGSGLQDGELPSCPAFPTSLDRTSSDDLT